MKVISAPVSSMKSPLYNFIQKIVCRLDKILTGAEKSILKLRFSIKGAKGRFIYAGVESFPVVEGSENTVFFCLSNSADSEHSFRGHGTVEMVARNGAVIFSEDFDSSVPVTPYGEAAVFVPTDSSFYFTLKLKLYDENDTLHDEMSLVYDYSKFNLKFTYPLISISNS